MYCQPGITPPAPFAAPAPQVFRLKNGLKVEFWQRPSVPLMALSLQTDHGADADAPAEGGLAHLTAAMLTQGAGKLHAKEFHEAADELGAALSASAGVRSMTVSLSVTAANFAPALKLYADAIVRPRFDLTELTRVKRVTLATIEQEDDDPGSVASRVADREFFGADHPYGRPVEGTKASVPRLSAKDLKQESWRLLSPATATLYVAGGLPLSAVKSKLEAAFAGRGSAVLWQRPTYGPPSPRPARLIIVDRPGAVQTVVRFLFPAPAFASPARQALTSMDLVLGGSFTSRLNHNLREDKGYTYGAGSGYAATPQLGFLSASADVRADVTGASLKEFLAEFAKISTGDITDAEAKKAARSRRQEMINGLERLEGLLAVAEGFASDGLPFTAFGAELAAASSVTADQMNSVAKTALPMDHMLLVLVGDKATILKQLAGLGLPTAEEVKP